MALKIKSLEPKKTGGVLVSTQDTYKDVAFDFVMETDAAAKNLFSNTTKKDLGVNTDYKAIDNSLTNIFNTAPGQKILNPRFGADLKRYLFQPVTEETAKILGEVILKAIQLYEPRVNVTEIFIKAFPEDHMYQIDLYCKIPSIKNNGDYRYKGALSSRGVVNVSGSY